MKKKLNLILSSSHRDEVLIGTLLGDAHLEKQKGAIHPTDVNFNKAHSIVIMFYIYIQFLKTLLLLRPNLELELDLGKSK